MWTGLLLALLGLFIVIRTVRPGSNGKTLVNYARGA